MSTRIHIYLNFTKSLIIKAEEHWWDHNIVKFYLQIFRYSSQAVFMFDFVPVPVYILKLVNYILGVGFIDNIKLDTARPGSNVGDPATWVEQCTCPQGFVGQFCESCAGGYKRDPPNSGSFSSCVPCQCFGHSDSCDPDSGTCILTLVSKLFCLL